MIDSHCHLDHDPLFSNLSEILFRSKNIGIEKLLTICTSIESFKNILKIVEVDKIVYGTFGIHPHEANNNFLKKEYIIKEISSHKKIIGVGETGLDFYYNNSDKDSQIKSFKSHIEAASELNIPLIVHSRNAENETFEILKKNADIKILMHCFTGSTPFAKDLISLNAYFSASGIITFNNANTLQETFKQIPVERLLVETDSPFLTPVPMRGKKNEPSFIKYTLEKLANLKNNLLKLLVVISSNFLLSIHFI